MISSFRELDPVVLVRDLPDEQLRAGDLGTVVSVAGDVLAVEFVTATGHTRALVTIDASAVRPVSGDDLLSVRSSPR